MTPRLSTAAAAAITTIALIGSAGVLPASAVAPGALGARHAVSNGSSVPSPSVAPAVATLPSGATAIVWVAASGAALYLRVRASGSTTWGAVKEYVPIGGYQIYADTHQPVVNFAPLGSSDFVLVWGEKNGSNRRVMAARVAAATASLSAVVISGSDTEVGQVSLSANAAGRAAVVWQSTGANATRLAVLASPTSTWGAPVSVAATNAYFPQVAVATNGTFCVQWLALVSGSTVKLVARCRTATAAPTSPSTWVTGMPAAKVIATKDIVGSLMGWSSIAASGNAFTSTLAATTPGSPPIVGAILATRIHVFSVPTAAGSWSAVTTVGLENQLLLRPTLSGSADGRAVLTYEQLDGSVGTSAGTNAGTLSTYVLDRSSTGAWSRPALLTATTASISFLLEWYALESVAFGANGIVVASGIQTLAGVAPQPVTFTSTVRSGWGVPVSQSVSWTEVSIFSAAAVAPSGRTTIAVVDLGVSGGLYERTTAMPKPFLLSRAKLSKAPKKGVSVACSSAWTDAASRTFTWLRNGSVIGGATSSTYKPTGADQGNGLSCRVKAVNSTGSTTSRSLERTVA